MTTVPPRPRDEDLDHIHDLTNAIAKLETARELIAEEGQMTLPQWLHTKRAERHLREAQDRIERTIDILKRQLHAALWDVDRRMGRG